MVAQQNIKSKNMDHHVPTISVFNEHETLHKLRHYLPAQAPLHEFIHHNTLHAFQHLPFDKAISLAGRVLGYKAGLSLAEYQQLYTEGKIHPEALERAWKEQDLLQDWSHCRGLLFAETTEPNAQPLVGSLRKLWDKHLAFDLDANVYPVLFRTLGSFLDQGVALSGSPVQNKSFIHGIKELQKKSYIGFFRSARAKAFLLNKQTTLAEVLQLLVGDERLFEQYLFDTQFGHPGWSGMVAVLEENPKLLLDQRQIKLVDLILFELLIELDTLDRLFGNRWKPLSMYENYEPKDLFASQPFRDEEQALAIWRNAFEYSYYDQVLKGISDAQADPAKSEPASFQAFFCIDDRECSLRRYVEHLDTNASTFGTPGFFGAAFYYKPENGKFYAKHCPAPVNPKVLVKELGSTRKHKKDHHYTRKNNALFQGWIISQTLGFWSALKLFFSIFRPSFSPATSGSFRHMDHTSTLTVAANPIHMEHEGGLQVGFTVKEMADVVEGVLKGTGLTDGYAPLIYMIGHGATSTNNPHYTAYECGACSGKPGSVNARVFASMANHAEVRSLLANNGLHIPEGCRFIGALHDTTRDEISFYDIAELNESQKEVHLAHVKVFEKALDLNAKERSRRFELVGTKAPAEFIHKKVLERSVSLFEPRPELNHATNALCVVGRRSLTRNLFLDRRSFMNSYDYQVDPNGIYLLGILQAVAPVCGGINLEYYFSRTDNEKLGAGSKLPHNVVGLFGVSNGIEGDLRTGLPSQMIEVHDPVRLLVIVEHFPEVVLATLTQSPATYEWFQNSWIHLVVIHPDSRLLFRFASDGFHRYSPFTKNLPHAEKVEELVESMIENIPVTKLNT